MILGILQGGNKYFTIILSFHLPATIYLLIFQLLTLAKRLKKCYYL